MKKFFIHIFVLTYLAFFIGHLSLVKAEYVLPYPSYMPGNKIYSVSRMMDKLKNYWYWGTIAQIKYHLSLSDKYLVEAKTLFEYKQYLLAADALSRSDAALFGISELLDKGTNENKHMSQYEQLIYDAMVVHQEKLEGMKELLPSEFIWTPEKKDATNLQIEQMLDESISIRNKIINELQGRMQLFTHNTYL